MQKLKYNLVFCGLATLFLASTGLAQHLTKYVDPFIGTGGHGHTYPGAAAPFGFMQLSPDTRLDGWDGCSGYHYDDSLLYGFSHTHLSGTGVSDYGDLLIMPFNSKRIQKDSKGRVVAAFSHQQEKAEPGYYAVELKKEQIFAELTVSQRSGIHHYQFKEGQGNIVIDLEHRDELLDFEFDLLSKNEIQGKRISKAWAEEQHFYFSIEFSKSFQIDSFTNDGKKLYLSFVNTQDLYLHVGISAVDEEGARRNRDSELSSVNFEKLRQSSTEAWEKELSKISIYTKDANFKKIYYTALYHSFLNPNIFSDVDGRFRGTDLKIHQDKDIQYTIFSLWDTFRATHPLFTLVQQDRTNAFIRTFLRQFKQGGKLPMWELAGNYTGCMIGYHAIPVIVDAYVKGLRDYSAPTALKAMLQRANQNELGVPSLLAQGFIPIEAEHESVSKTLEYAYNDWCIAVFAEQLGNTTVANLFYRRAQNYKNLMNPIHGFMQGKIFNMFQEPFDPREVNFNFTEGNSWQYSFFVPHDIQGLNTLYKLNGLDLVQQLDELFSTTMETTGRHQADITGLIGQYAHGNEPSHHIAFMYNYLGQPHKTQFLTRRLIEEMYTSKPDGLCGNEDCGQMSSWLNLTALGIYSVAPGSSQYALTAPYVDSADINLENGNQFRIIAKDLNTKNIYIQKIELNGVDMNRLFLEHVEIMKGGKLVFFMGPEPSSYGAQNPPQSSLSNRPFSPVPFIKGNRRTFSDSLQIELASVDPNQKIYYTLDGTNPNSSSTLYKGPLLFKSNVTLKAIAYMDTLSSQMINTEFFKVPANWKVTLLNEYATSYSGGGPGALIDKIRGGHDFRTGAWQGYQGKDFVAIVDMGSKQQISRVGANFFQEIRSWIWMPKYLNVYTSNDGKKWNKVATINHGIPSNSYETGAHELVANIKKTRARYVKFEAPYFGKMPEWHLSAGEESYVFVDELIIE